MLALVPGQAILERIEGSELRVIRAERDLPAFELATSSCGHYTSLSVNDVLDAVFASDGRCVYARSTWIADLSPAGGRCEFCGGELSAVDS